MGELTDDQWERIEPHLPPQPRSRKGGRPRADDRACFEGVPWVLRSGARWKDLPRDRGFPSPATCWRRLARWERGGVWLRLWRAFLDELDGRGRLDWGECFAGATFAPAKEGGRRVGKTKRGEGSKLVVVVGGQGVPLALSVHSASPSETKMIEPTLDRLPRQPERPAPDRAFDSDKFRDRIKARGTDPIVPYRKRAVGMMRHNDGRKMRRYKRRWKVERTFAWLGNFRRLVVRYEHKQGVYRAFIHVACVLITLRQF